MSDCTAGQERVRVGDEGDLRDAVEAVEVREDTLDCEVPGLSVEGVKGD